MPICLICGTDFTPKRSGGHPKYCSRTCSAVGRSRAAVNTCAHCGKTFGGDKCGGHIKRRKYCSRECAHSGHISRVEVQCSECGQVMTVNLYRLRKQGAFCCSRACAGKAKSRITGIDNPAYRGGEKLATRACLTCGKIFEYSPSRVHAKFCSRRCKGAWMSVNNSGVNHPRYRGGKVKARGRNWQFQSRQVLERDGYRCQICRKKLHKQRGDYGVHHIKPYRLFNGDYVAANQLLNLITLCRHCHALVEIGKLACPQPLL